MVKLRGKWDSVDLIDGGIYLQENKTKGDIREEQLQRQLTFDLQTMLYLVALVEVRNDRRHDRGIQVENIQQALQSTYRIAGVRYNVIRRPLSGGKGSIVRHKGTANKPEETFAYYYGRLGEIINENRAYFFMRWKVEVNPRDVERFRDECLDPVLENLCDDYEWWSYISRQQDGDTDSPTVFDSEMRHTDFPHHFPRHHRHPYGVYNILDEGGSSDLDEYLVTKSKVGLVRMDNLFPELL